MRHCATTESGKAHWEDPRHDAALCGVTLGLLRAEPAWAQGGGSPAGPTPPAVDARDDRVQRRAIRGGSVDLSRESPEFRELRGFEEERSLRATLRQSVLSGSAERPGRRGAGSPGDGAGGELPADGFATVRRRRSPVPGARCLAVRRRPFPWLQALKLLGQPGAEPDLCALRVARHSLPNLFKEERRGRSIMTSWLRKQGRYRQLIEQTLDKHGLPRFLLYVAMIESGYDPHDRSHKGAVGLWQFMPEGARIYGLRVDHWVDERKDPQRSTEAAARYLGDLKRALWFVAPGAGGVQCRLWRGAARHAEVQHQRLLELCRHEDGLPWETLNYVPKQSPRR